MTVPDAGSAREPGALDSLPELFASFDRVQDPDEAMTLALDALVISLRTERVTITVRREGEAPRSRARRLSDDARAILDSIAAHESGSSSRLIPDVAYDPELAPMAAALISDRVRSAALFSIVLRGRTWGHLGAAFERPRDFSDAERAAAHAIAHSVAAALERIAGLADENGAPVTGSHLDAVLDAAPDAIVLTDRTGCIRWVNAQTERWLGWTRAELEGESFDRLVPEAVRHVDVEHRASFRSEPRMRPVGADLDLRAVTKDGVELAVEVTLSTIRIEGEEAVAAFIRDGGDGVSAEEAAAESLRVETALAEADKARKRSAYLTEATRLLTSSLDVVARLEELARISVPVLADGCVIDLVSDDGSIRRVAAAHTDATKEAMLHDLPKEIVAPPVVDLLETEAPDGTSTAEPRALRTDPERVRFLRDIGSVMVIPLVAHGRTFGMLTCFRTWSGAYAPDDLEFAQDLANRIAAALDNARRYDLAHEANRLKDEFLATLSHELRTPLNAIVGWAHLLECGELDPAKTRVAIETIQRSAKAQSQIIGDILDFSRITVGHLRLQVCRVDLDAVLDEVVEEARGAAESRGIRLETRIERGTTVFGDPVRIGQMLRHLLSNAIKFSDGGGFVHLEARREGATATIVVRDQGIGIPPEVLPHVFDRQARTEATAIHGRRGGLGLGLAIARHLVELHGGRLEADSEGEGRGAAFTLALPIRSATASSFGWTAPDSDVPDREPESFGFTDLRVVAVDDESDVRQLLETLLGNRGARVWTASSASEALALITAVLPDVLLVDIGMAERDGYWLVRELRSRRIEEGGEIPAIALTAFARDLDRQRAIEAGCQLHVAKPVEPDLLLHAIHQVVAQSRSSLERTRRVPETRGV